LHLSVSSLTLSCEQEQKKHRLLKALEGCRFQVLSDSYDSDESDDDDASGCKNLCEDDFDQHKKFKECIRLFLLESQIVGFDGNSNTRHELVVKYGNVYHFCINYKDQEAILNELNFHVAMDAGEPMEEGEKADLIKQKEAQDMKMESILTPAGHESIYDKCCDLAFMMDQFFAGKKKREQKETFYSDDLDSGSRYVDEEVVKVESLGLY
jgi:hypothetical protein